jgi:branched-chain amino acid transport system substrate-binding protein
MRATQLPKLAVTAVIAVVALSLAACGSNGSGAAGGGAAGGGSSAGGSSSGGSSSGAGSPAASGSPYLIGYANDLSGEGVAYGKADLQIWTAVVNSVNASGGVNGHPLKLVTVDSQDTATTSTAAAHQVIGDNPLMIVGYDNTDVCAEGFAVTQSSGIPLSCEYAASSNLDPVQPGLFSEWSPEGTEATGVVKYLHSKYGANPRIAMIPIALAGELEWATQVKSAVAAQGGTITTEQQVPYTDMTNVSAQVGAILASNPQAVLEELPSAGAEGLIKALRTGGYKGEIIDMSSDYLSMASTKDPGFLTTWDSAVVNPAATEAGPAAYVKIMTSAGLGSATNLNNLINNVNYLAALDAVQALKACPSTCTAAAVQTALNTVSVNIPGLTLPSGYGYTSTRHYPTSQFALYAWNNSAGAPALVSTQPLS